MSLRMSMVLALLAAITMATTAWAQYPGGAGGTGGPGGAGGTRGGMGGGRGGPPPDAMRGGPPVDAPLSPGAIVQVQLDQLEDDLKLVPAQIGAWRAYTDKVQKLADDTTRIRFEARTAAPGPSSAIQQLDEIDAQMRSRKAAVDEIVDLGKALYATLTPEQKSIADRRLSPVVSLLTTGVAPAGTLDGGSRGGRRPSP